MLSDQKDPHVAVARAETGALPMPMTFANHSCRVDRVSTVTELLVRLTTVPAALTSSLFDWANVLASAAVSPQAPAAHA